MIYNTGKVHMARTKIPNDWVPSPDTVNNLRSDYPESTIEDIQYEHKQFRRWFRASGKVYADWDARFEFWCAENFDKRRRSKPSSHVATSTKDVSDRKSRLVRVAKGGDSKSNGNILNISNKKRD
tara:strand:+ start:116 stop:490 length:375 start_codon:yes stop_codon:yes gene_type:complete